MPLKTLHVLQTVHTTTHIFEASQCLTVPLLHVTRNRSPYALPSAIITCSFWIPASSKPPTQVRPQLRKQNLPPQMPSSQDSNKKIGIVWTLHNRSSPATAYQLQGRRNLIKATLFTSISATNKITAMRLANRTGFHVWKLLTIKLSSLRYQRTERDERVEVEADYDKKFIFDNSHLPYLFSGRACVLLPLWWGLSCAQSFADGSFHRWMELLRHETVTQSPHHLVRATHRNEQITLLWKSSYILLF